jgi:uncharacterized protein DUF4224
MFLDREEIVQLTGYRQRAKQIEALVAMRVRFHVPPDGWPRVAKEDITHGAKTEEPDFSSL